MDLTIDLQKSTPVSSVSLTVNVSKGAAVMDATGLEVWCSEDGKEYRKLASASYPVLDKEGLKVALFTWICSSNTLLVSSVVTITAFSLVSSRIINGSV